MKLTDGLARWGTNRRGEHRPRRRLIRDDGTRPSEDVGQPSGETAGVALGTLPSRTLEQVGNRVDRRDELDVALLRGDLQCQCSASGYRTTHRRSQRSASEKASEASDVRKGCPFGRAKSLLPEELNLSSHHHRAGDRVAPKSRHELRKRYWERPIRCVKVSGEGPLKFRREWVAAAPAGNNEVTLRKRIETRITQDLSKIVGDRRTLLQQYYARMRGERCSVAPAPSAQLAGAPAIFD